MRVLSRRYERGSTSLIEMALAMLLIGLVVLLALPGFKTSTDRATQKDNCLLRSRDVLDASYAAGSWTADVNIACSNTTAVP